MYDSAPTPLWYQQTGPRFPRLSGGENAEIAIVGGGLAGLLTAYWLQQEGIQDIVLVEARRIGAGSSGASTGKITALHSMLYSTLNKLPDDHGRIVADVLTRSVEHYAQIINTEGIDCNFSRQPAVVFSSDAAQKDKLEREFEAASRLGLQVRYSEEALELPVAPVASLWLDNQARFHPYKFIVALADLLRQRGLRIYEDTPVQQIHGLKLHTPEGQVSASRIILATRFPISDPSGGFFAKIIQERGYLVALRNAPELQAMYLDIADEGFTWCSHQLDRENLLLFGGLPHKVGFETDQHHLPRLLEAARQYYPRAQVVARWSAQDCMSFDDIPLFGPLYGTEHRIYALTAFNKWGNSASMAGAYLVAQAIAHGESAEIEPFLPKRLQPRLQIGGLASSLGDVISQLAEKFIPPLNEILDIEPGHGGAVRYRGETLGIYRDTENRLHTVIPTCSHLGCPLHWNPDALTWDCPCHGSNFSIDGEPLGSPGHRPLERVELES